uniref:RING-type E3 ubiquitin transferase n=1 Tax=Loa loa TaxID=7209 RepID=A0A1I7VM45_LOALO
MAPAGQSALWSSVLCCRICSELFSSKKLPINLACGHTICHNCLKELSTKSCPLDQALISLPSEKLPPNLALLSVLSEFINNEPGIYQELSKEYRHIEATLVELASYLHPVECLFGGSVWSDELSRPMQRKLISLLCYQLMEHKGLQRALKTARALAERALSELIVYHQDNSNISTVLWSAVRSRGCQFLGPAMQEEVLSLILLILSDGALMSRKTLVLYIVQTLRQDYPQASKTCVGHVVQLLYRASCFNVLKREGESSLMQLKTQFRDYGALRREHDAQIVQVAFEQGLRISPDQWSALLYGDQHHRSHMQSIIDKLQSAQDFEQQINDLKAATEQSSERDMLIPTFEHFERFANFDYLSEVPDWILAVDLFDSLLFIIKTYVKFMQTRSVDKFVSTTNCVRPNVCRKSNQTYKTCSRSFSNSKNMAADRIYPTSLQCTYALAKNGFHAPKNHAQLHPLPVLIEPMPPEYDIFPTVVPQLRVAELPPLLTNASAVSPLSAAAGSNGFAKKEESFVNQIRNLLPVALPIPLEPLMIPAVNYPVPSPLLPVTSVIQVGVPEYVSLPVGMRPISLVPSSFGYISGSDNLSGEVCSTQSKIPIEPPNLSQMQDGVHRVRYDPCAEGGYASKNNEIDEEQSVLSRPLECPQHTESTYAAENADVNNLPRNSSVKVVTVSTVVPTVSPYRIRSAIPAAIQAPCTVVHIRDTIKQPLQTPCIQQSESYEQICASEGAEGNR